MAGRPGGWLEAGGAKNGKSARKRQEGNFTWWNAGRAGRLARRGGRGKILRDKARKGAGGENTDEGVPVGGNFLASTHSFVLAFSIMYRLTCRLAVSTCVLLLAAAPVALAGPKDYQVTGVIQSINDTTIVIIQKEKEVWELGRDTNTKGAEALKVGDKVTMHYTMTASTVEPKAAAKAAAGKKDKADAAAPAAGPKA